MNELRSERGASCSDLAELCGLYFKLDRGVDSLTSELRQMARSSDYAQQTELLSTVPGIGWLTALTLIRLDGMSGLYQDWAKSFKTK